MAKKDKTVKMDRMSEIDETAKKLIYQSDQCDQNDQSGQFGQNGQIGHDGQNHKSGQRSKMAAKIENAKTV